MKLNTSRFTFNHNLQFKLNFNSKINLPNSKLANEAVDMLPATSTIEFCKLNSFSNISLSIRAPTEANEPTMIA